MQSHLAAVAQALKLQNVKVRLRFVINYLDGQKTACLRIYTDKLLIFIGYLNIYAKCAFLRIVKRYGRERFFMSDNRSIKRRRARVEKRVNESIMTVHKIGLTDAWNYFMTAKIGEGIRRRT